MRDVVCQIWIFCPTYEDKSITKVNSEITTNHLPSRQLHKFLLIILWHTTNKSMFQMQWASNRNFVSIVSLTGCNSTTSGHNIAKLWLNKLRRMLFCLMKNMMTRWWFIDRKNRPNYKIFQNNATHICFISLQLLKNVVKSSYACNIHAIMLRNVM